MSGTVILGFVYHTKFRPPYSSTAFAHWCVTWAASRAVAEGNQRTQWCVPSGTSYGNVFASKKYGSLLPPRCAWDHEQPNLRVLQDGGRVTT
jgi:hypothetical protein